MAVSDRDLNCKLTIRLSRELLDALRDVSETTGASLNSVAIAAMSAGWPQIPLDSDPGAVLASRTTRPASKAYDRNAFAQLVEPLRPQLGALQRGTLGDDVVWVRGDR